MRITNKIMRNNSLYNINNNKILEDKLSTQMTNQSKITRPSDDPVVAVRALRLRTNVTTVTQYYEKNSPDADSWLSITEDALATVSGVLKNLYEQATDGAKKSLKAEDMEIFVTQIESYTKEFYASGNVDYAGRYVFSGFRTDTPITFSREDIKQFTKEPENLKTYVINESRKFDDISTISYTDWTGITTDTTPGPNLGKPIGDENSVTNTLMYRFRLSYDDLNYDVDANDNTIVDTATLPNHFELTINGADVTVPAYTDSETAYQKIANGDVDIAYIPSTGEIVFSEAFYEDPQAALEQLEPGITSGMVLNSIEDIKIDVKYAKSNWQEGDLNPVHYFHCLATDQQNEISAMDLGDKQAVLEAAQIALAAVTQTNAPQIEAKQKDLEKAKLALKNGTGTQAAVDALRADIATLQAGIDTAQADVEAAQADVGAIKRNVTEYNADDQDQDIYYNVGFNQTIQVNTQADEVFTHDVQRDLDDLRICLKQLQDAEEKISSIEEKMKEYTEDSADYKALSNQLEAMNKACTYIRDNVQKKFENQITKYQKYIDATNVAITNNGTRGSRLELITNRLMNQQATFKDLQSNNEDVDVTEVAVKLKSSELAYEASLMATSKIMQTNLMNYI